MKSIGKSGDLKAFRGFRGLQVLLLQGIEHPSEPLILQDRLLARPRGLPRQELEA